MLKRFHIAALVVFCSLFVFHDVSAQTTESLRLVTSPLPINLAADPGTTVSSPIRIKNDGTATEKLKISIMKFKAYGDNGAPQLMDPAPEDQFVSWISFSENTFSIAPGEWKTITATIALPKTAAFGYYYAVVFSRADDTTVAQERQTALSGGTAVLVLLEAKVADAKRQVDVVSFTADRKWYEFLPATFTIKLKNSGNVHVSPYGDIFIGRSGQKGDFDLKVNQGEGRGSILPDSNREFTAEWNDGFPSYQDKIEDGKIVRDENGNIIKELTWDFKDAAKLRFGKYQAKLIMVYDNGQRDELIEATVSFWVMPWRLMGVAMIIILFALVGFKSTFSSLWEKAFGKRKSIQK
jgi:hypothetical protein